MNRVVWSASSLHQINSVIAFVEQTNPQAARRLAAALIAAGNGLCVFPYRGRSVPGTDLRELATRFPYIIRYQISPVRVLIVRVRHTYRRPTTP